MDQLSGPATADQQAKAAIITRIEDIVESIVDSLTENRPMAIPLRSRSSGNDVAVSFPSATGTRRFTAALHILFLCREALVTGNIITKRNIYYQNPDLFQTQDYVDRLVDDIAYTFGVGRSALNIAAAVKGVVAGGPFGDGEDRQGVAVPTTRPAHGWDLRSTRWILVIEKDATFRSLAASRYFETSAAGPGVIVTAKGYPDLDTRRFLHDVHAQWPEIPMHVLVDFDPDGIAIMRTYKHGSLGLRHEQNTTVPELVWLGIKSGDVLDKHRSSSSQSQSLQGIQTSLDTPSSSQTSVDQVSTPPSLTMTAPAPLYLDDKNVRSLTARDRKKAISILRLLTDEHDQNAEEMELTRELQVMMALNVKFEIQAVDEAGNMAQWLDERLPAPID